MIALKCPLELLRNRNLLLEFLIEFTQKSSSFRPTKSWEVIPSHLQEILLVSLQGIYHKVSSGVVTTIFRVSRQQVSVISCTIKINFSFIFFFKKILWQYVYIIFGSLLNSFEKISKEISVEVTSTIHRLFFQKFWNIP